MCRPLWVWGGPAPPHLGDPDYNLGESLPPPLGLLLHLCPSPHPWIPDTAPEGVCAWQDASRAALSVPTGPSADWLGMAEVTRGPGPPRLPTLAAAATFDTLHLPGHSYSLKKQLLLSFPATALPAQASSGREKAVCSVARERFLWGTGFGQSYVDWLPSHGPVTVTQKQANFLLPWLQQEPPPHPRLWPLSRSTPAPAPPGHLGSPPARLRLVSILCSCLHHGPRVQRAPGGGVAKNQVTKPPHSRATGGAGRAPAREGALGGTAAPAQDALF